MPHHSNESGQCEVPNLRRKTKTFAKVIYMFLSINISFLLRGCASLRTEARGDGSPGAGSQIMGWLAAFWWFWVLLVMEEVVCVLSNLVLTCLYTAWLLPVPKE